MADLASTNALDALRELERTYGTAALADAMEQLRYDRGFTSRHLAADPQRTARILALLPEQPSRLDRRFADTVLGAAATATPYPGTLAEDAPAVTR